MINMQFNQRVVINTNNHDWVTTPMHGIWRKCLEREDTEKGHVTSIVKYDPNTSFQSHTHPLGEEILVLEGTFSDEYGDYKKGTYIRNPPGSKHTPFSKDGCVLFVKLNQFNPNDRTRVCIDTSQTAWLPGQGGLHVIPLHDFEDTHVALVKWPSKEYFHLHKHFGGEEIYVITGKFKDEHGSYPNGTWLRNPHMSEHQPFVEENTIIWVKVGHLFNQPF